MTTVERPLDISSLVSFNSCVSRDLVHRKALAEVFLTDWARVGEDSFLLGAQWPRSHSFYAPRDGRHDPMLVAETVRQAGILLAHKGYDVPLGHSFLMDRITLAVHQDEMTVGDEPADLLIEVEARDVLRRARGINGMRVDMTFRRAGVRIASGSGWVRVAGPGVYRRLRWGGEPRLPGPACSPTPLTPEIVGVTSVDDVVLGEPTGRWTWPLRVRTGHPVLFDHPLDHVPGMVTLEAMRQAGRAVLGRPGAQPLDLDASFPRFLELDRECLVSAEVLKWISPSVAVLSVQAIQDGVVAAEAVLTMAA
ncbi:hypothetical protein UK23_16145 [Lentzea aerocolonigenes]|uniref:A-factor biosynthesis hotdog domain-containing protein n=1 Tax=Lentzea aerocolonigenes TaxID=68170 RepID=A0A0F0H506_LENAE|nr:ScbA/BarX family gamma-butyrolactone biosynthesis protein [Lentzea aerocolonigenes]KJK48698.1 hypothetical protein UK23_16145 [Lentzea aerocolonigenes]